MDPFTQADPETKSVDVLAENVGRLSELFPEIVADGAVDLEALRQLLGEVVDDSDERFGLNWHGKRRARQFALTPSTGTLRPCPDESVDWDTTQNLMIEGDNLEVLKLLQKSYAGKVKLIYIDPPYNTGKDFVYPDNFKDSIGNYLALTGQTDDEGQKLTSNTEASGRFHTDWLNMMLPRLMLARNLLRADGVLYVSIDDSEVGHLRDLCDDVFGEENFVASVVWRKRVSPANDAQWYSSDHEYVVVYAKQKDLWKPNRTQRTADHDKYYTNPDNDTRGPWNSAAYTCNKSRAERPNLYYPLIHPVSGAEVWPDESAVWAYSQETHQDHVAQDLLYWGASGQAAAPRKKQFLTDAKPVVPRSVWDYSEVGSTQSATSEIRELVTGFGYPKPSSLLTKVIYQATEPDQDDIVVDFFAGSGTTGHAVMAQNAADAGRRRYVAVQLPEPLDPENKDQRTAADQCDELGVPRTIAELTKERLRRAGGKLADAYPDHNVDIGFRVFKLDTSNLRPWDPHPDDLEGTLEEAAEHVKPDRTEDDVLYEILIKLGLDLCVPIQTTAISGLDVHAIGGGVLVACLSDKVAGEQLEALATGIAEWVRELAPVGDTTCVFRDSAFTDDVAKTNLTTTLAQAGIATVRSI